MALRDNIAAGLRAFSYANPTMAQLNEAQIAREQTRQDEKKKMIAQLIANGVTSGQIDPTEGGIALKRLGGYDELTTGNIQQGVEGPVQPRTIFGAKKEPDELERITATVNGKDIPAILNKTTAEILDAETRKPIPNAMIKEGESGRSGYFTPKEVFNPGTGETEMWIFNHRKGSWSRQEAPWGGAMVSPKSAEAEAGVAGAKETAKAEATRTFNMSGINEALDQAEKVMLGLETGHKPTQSTVGNLYDFVSSIVGYTPEGAGEADILRALGGSLTAKMPRMEGPQSDKDVQLYREMAGRIGDSTLPVSRRLTALKTVKRLWAKYEKQNKQKSSDKWSIEEVK